MKVSLNIVRQYINFELPPVNELVARINAQLGGVEEVIDLNAKYKDAKIVKVFECEKHPNADRLNVCKIDAGTGELIQVVCGAPNVHADMWAVWLPPESIVPASYDTDEPFTLSARELRGVMSHGMLAAADELAIGIDHAGILEITEQDLQTNDIVLKPGVSFAQTFGLDDTIIDIENKMFTHRPDLFGQLGVAREIAGILGQKFISPQWYMNTPEFEAGEGLELSVFNDTPKNVSRIMYVAMKNVDIKPSPVWLQCALVAMGSKPINNIVDITNYVMLVTAQPTHAYDYDKLRGKTIGARMAKAGDKITLLNNKTYELTPDDIVIADGQGPVGLGGIMGAATSEVDESTKNIVLEIGTFDMYTVRKMSMRHGVFTDALTRFNKGQSPLQNDYVLNLLMTNTRNVSGAEQASKVFDEKNEKTGITNRVEVSPEFINQRLGLELSENEVATLLESVEFIIHHSPFTVEAPFWRTDIEVLEDIVEEVGRLYGFDKLPRELPQRTASPAPKNPEIAAKQHIRERLARAGSNEVLTYSFVHENILKKAGQDPAQAFQLSNALSPDLQYYRLSLLPSLLDKVHMNSKAGYDKFALFEIGKVHHVGINDEDKLPKELGRIAQVFSVSGSTKAMQSAYYHAKRQLDYLIETILPGAVATYTRIDQYDVPDFAPFRQLIAPFDTVRSAIVEIDGKIAGVVGEFRSSVVRDFKLPAQTSGFELFITPFVRQVAPTYRVLSKYPSVQRDICFKVDQTTTYAQVYASATETVDTLDIKVEPLDIYQAAGEQTKNITLRFTLTSNEKTLTSDEVTAVTDTISRRVIDRTNAQIV